MRYLFLLALLFTAASSPAGAQGRWNYTDGGEGPKFGYIPDADGNNFFPLWMHCDRVSKQVVISAMVVRQGSSGRSHFSLGVAGNAPAVVEGAIAPEDFDGHYVMTATIARNHPLFAILARNQPMHYQSGMNAWRLDTANLTATLQRWTNACR